MVRSEIISKLSNRIHHKLRRKDLEKIFQIILDTIIQGLKNNKSIELRDFGRFSVKELKDKIAIVTAAGQGIGKATAIAFSNEGAKVIATDINDKTLNELKKEFPKIEVQKLDSTDNDSIKV